MATSRTGTTVYKRNSAKALRQARQAGIEHCPCRGTCRHHTGRPCGVWLDYENRRRPNGATADHVLAHANGGSDAVDNLTVLCFRCNTALGAKRRRPTHRVETIDFT